MPKKGLKRHSAEQIVEKLRDAATMVSAGETIGETNQSLGITEPSFYRRRSKYGGMQSEEARRLKELEAVKHLLSEFSVSDRLAVARVSRSLRK